MEEDTEFYINKLIEKSIENQQLMDKIQDLDDKLQENKRRLSHIEVELDHCKWVSDKILRKID
jgi:predicted nuclease with TOPRIM domain